MLTSSFENNVGLKDCVYDIYVVGWVFVEKKTGIVVTQYKNSIIWVPHSICVWI
jgi:hypothetical protein